MYVRGTCVSDGGEVLEGDLRGLLESIGDSNGMQSPVRRKRRRKKEETEERKIVLLVVVEVQKGGKREEERQWKKYMVNHSLVQKFLRLLQERSGQNDDSGGSISDFIVL